MKVIENVIYNKFDKEGFVPNTAEITVIKKIVTTVFEIAFPQILGEEKYDRAYTRKEISLRLENIFNQEMNK